MTVFIGKGDEPLTNDQLAARTESYIAIDWPVWKRERATRLGTDPSLKATSNVTALNVFMVTVATDTDTNRANNVFNRQLVDYRMATTRLAQIVLSVGRKAYSGQIATGETVWNDKTMTNDPVMATVKHPAIKALPKTVSSMDMQGKVITVPNPLVAQDEAERVASQAVITATPAPVKAF